MGHWSLDENNFYDMGVDQIFIPCAPYLKSLNPVTSFVIVFPFLSSTSFHFFLVLDRLHSLQINSSLSTYSLVDSVGNTKTCKI